MSHAFAINGARLLFAKELKAWRGATLGLPGKAARKPAAGALYAYSTAVLPKPSEWGADVLVTGYWFLDRPDWQPDEALEFLPEGWTPTCLFRLREHAGDRPCSHDAHDPGGPRNEREAWPACRWRRCDR